MTYLVNLLLRWSVIHLNLFSEHQENILTGPPFFIWNIPRTGIIRQIRFFQLSFQMNLCIAGLFNIIPASFQHFPHTQSYC
jgi:hypothetical protein